MTVNIAKVHKPKNLAKEPVTNDYFITRYSFPKQLPRVPKGVPLLEHPQMRCYRRQSENNFVVSTSKLEDRLHTSQKVTRTRTQERRRISAAVVDFLAKNRTVKPQVQYSSLPIKEICTPFLQRKTAQDFYGSERETTPWNAAARRFNRTHIDLVLKQQST